MQLGAVPEAEQVWRSCAAGFESVWMARAAGGADDWRHSVVLQQAQLNHSCAPAFVCLQAYAWADSSNTSRWCRKQMQQAGRKEERLCYAVGRMQDAMATR